MLASSPNQSYISQQEERDIIPMLSLSSRVLWNDKDEILETPNEFLDKLKTRDFITRYLYLFSNHPGIILEFLDNLLQELKDENQVAFDVVLELCNCH